jgi:hypothetical protein
MNHLAFVLALAIGAVIGATGLAGAQLAQHDHGAMQGGAGGLAPDAGPGSSTGQGAGPGGGHGMMQGGMMQGGMMGRGHGGGAAMDHSMSPGDAPSSEHDMHSCMMHGDAAAGGRGMGGQGMGGQGMMGRGMGGRGMDHGMTGQGRGRMADSGAPGAGGLFGSRVTPVMNLSVEDVRGYLDQRVERLGNKRLKVGDVTVTGTGVITADVVTVDNSLVQRLSVNRRTGAIDYVD